MKLPTVHDNTGVSGGTILWYWVVEFFDKRLEWERNHELVEFKNTDKTVFFFNIKTSDLTGIMPRPGFPITPQKPAL